MSSDLENLSISEFKKIKKEYHNIIKKTKVNRRYKKNTKSKKTD